MRIIPYNICDAMFPPPQDEAVVGQVLQLSGELYVNSETGKPLPTRLLMQVLEKGDECFVAKDQELPNKVLGFANVSYKPAKRYAWLEALAVDPAYRSNCSSSACQPSLKVGTKLVERVFEKAGNLGLQTVVLEAGGSSRGFYERLGFAEVYDYKGVYSMRSNTDIPLMIKEL